MANEQFELCRKHCFGNRNDKNVCTCLKNVEDNCKFFKTPEDFRSQKEYYAEQSKVERVHILRTASGVMYY